ncbi:MAG: Uma2 family endonuclease [Cyanobacteria bacterium P01_E01_bin.6]
MTQAMSQPLTLEKFLKLPETKPASEFVDGTIIQKPMPKGKHSRLQLKLCSEINTVAETQGIAYAFPELRCSFGTRSVVPDVAVFYWPRIAFDANGEPENDVLTYPDWVIEILSPDQRPNRVIDNIVYCLKAGCQLGWLIDPEDRTVTIYQPETLPIFCEGMDALTVLDEISLSITAGQLFDLLKMQR